MQIPCASVSVSDAKKAKYACKSRAAAYVFDVSGRGLLKFSCKSSCDYSLCLHFLSLNLQFYFDHNEMEI